MKRDDIKTSIFVPLQRDSKAIGIVEFEATSYLEPTEIAKQELSQLAKAISGMRALSELHNSQGENTSNAINRFRASLNNASWPDLRKPQMFVASPSIRVAAVFGEIKNVLDKFPDHIHVVYWDQISASGDITRQIVEESRSRKLGSATFQNDRMGPTVSTSFATIPT